MQLLYYIALYVYVYAHTAVGQQAQEGVVVVEEARPVPDWHDSNAGDLR